jgi:hypothetical protein
MTYSDSVRSCNKTGVVVQVFDENINPYFNETVKYYNLTDPLTQTNQTEANWEEANLKHAINGKMFCWNEGFVIPAGKRWATRNQSLLPTPPHPDPPHPTPPHPTPPHPTPPLQSIAQDESLGLGEH